ncbi:50S ribosomal protein L6 [bacterium DOLZORAL124_38_8]|nr:MAG: 50S ribosomal protein L6 [bacterium DOLZORAL124_38_8]
MSRIGKKPVVLLDGVQVEVKASELVVTGPKGELRVAYEPEYVSFKVEGQEVAVERADESRIARSRHGLYRTLLNNAVEGVKNGCSKSLEIIGVGYRGVMKGPQELELSLGYSHPILYKVKEGVTVTFADKSQTELTVSGIDKQAVGQVAAEIRSFRKPEPYKGKGIRYKGEFVFRKAGKSNAK